MARFLGFVSAILEVMVNGPYVAIPWSPVVLFGAYRSHHEAKGTRGGKGASLRRPWETRYSFTIGNGWAKCQMMSEKVGGKANQAH